MSKGATVKDINATQFVNALAAHFKKSGKYEVPVWADLVKTGIQTELPPQSADWFYFRLAAIARKVYLANGVGIGELAHAFGGAHANSCNKKHHVQAARGNIRAALQALEKTNLIGKKEGKDGRFITAAGRRELDVLATSLAKAAQL